VGRAAIRAQVATIKERLDRAALNRSPPLDRLRRDPARILTEAGLTPDRWQEDVLRCSADRLLLLCGRQTGKSTTAAALALRTALLRPGSLTLLVSPSLRQSSELFSDKVMRLFNGLGRPVPAARETALALELSSGSRIVSLPGDEATIRGFSSVALLVIDEASRVPDELYGSVRPMLAVSRGRLVCLSTPAGKRGFFFAEWSEGQGWHKVRVTADECERISRDFLAAEERSLGPR
jgi:hypothetical protein